MAKPSDPTTMPVRDAIDALRAIEGLRAAFQGFPQAVTGAASLLHKLMQVEEEISIAEQRVVALTDEISALGDAKEAAITKHARVTENHEAEKQLLAEQKQKLLDDINAVQEKLVAAEKAHTERVSKLTQDYNDLEQLVAKLRAEYDTFRKRVGLTITSSAA